MSCDFQLFHSTFLLLHILALIVDVAPGVVLFHHCNGEQLLKSRLPSTRNLWQANSANEWEKEYKMQCRRSRNCCGDRSLTYSDLLEHEIKNDGTLDSWLSDIDEFGNLVLAVASIHDCIES